MECYLQLKRPKYVGFPERRAQLEKIDKGCPRWQLVTHATACPPADCAFYVVIQDV